MSGTSPPAPSADAPPPDPTEPDASSEPSGPGSRRRWALEPTRPSQPHWAWTGSDPATAAPSPPARRRLAGRRALVALRPLTGRGPLTERQRRLAAVLAPAGLVILAVVLVLSLTAGGDGPATGAATLVPSDALVYLHVSTDTGRPAARRAQALLARLPGGGALLSTLDGRFVSVLGGSTSTSYARDIRPWIGPEAAFAVLDTSGTSAGSIVVAAVRDHARATAFLRRAGARPDGRDGGDALLRYPTGTELAFVAGYLVAGQPQSVDAAIRASSGALPPLASDPTYRQATADEPADRVLDAYVSSGGVQRVLDSRGGFFGALGTVLSQPSLIGAAVSLSPQRHGMRVFVHAALDSNVAGAQAARLAAFTPTLPAVLPAGTTMLLEARDLARWAPTVLGDLGRVGLLGQVPGLVAQLGPALASEGVDVHAALRLFAGETAVAEVTGSGPPALVLVARTGDPAGAARTLAGLEGPLMQIFAPTSSGSGVAPEISDVQVGGVTAHQLALGPGLTIDYAVAHGLIVISTSPRGIGDVMTARGRLDRAAAFRAALSARPGQVSSLGYVTSRQLLSLGEQTTLSQGAVFGALLPDLQHIEAVGMDSTRGEPDTTAELFLHIP